MRDKNYWSQRWDNSTEYNERFPASRDEDAAKAWKAVDLLSTYVGFVKSPIGPVGTGMYNQWNNLVNPNDVHRAAIYRAIGNYYSPSSMENEGMSGQTIFEVIDAVNKMVGKNKINETDSLHALLQCICDKVDYSFRVSDHEYVPQPSPQNTDTNTCSIS